MADCEQGFHNKLLKKAASPALRHEIVCQEDSMRVMHWKPMILLHNNTSLSADCKELDLFYVEYVEAFYGGEYPLGALMKHVIIDVSFVVLVLFARCSTLSDMKWFGKCIPFILSLA